MLNKEQNELFDQLTDEFVDQAEMPIDPEELEKAVKKVGGRAEHEIWNGTVGSSAPAISGAADPSCPQDGNNPCASCDCC